MIRHPRVQPYGNLLANGGINCRQTGLGALARLEDQIILQVLGQLPAEALACLAMSSKSLYCFANHEDLWRHMTLQELESNFQFTGSWRGTYITCKHTICHTTAQDAADSKQRKAYQHNNPGMPMAEHNGFRCDGSLPVASQDCGQPVRLSKSRKRKHQQVASSTANEARLCISNFYSDLLYQPWHCAHVPLKPSWLAGDAVPRCSELTPTAFREQYEVPNRPVIITDAVRQWPALGKWTCKYLKKAFHQKPVIVGEYPMDFDEYLAYMAMNTDEMPLYLFDKHFADKAPSLAHDYQLPPQFSDDLFAAMGPKNRPDHRWLILGPARSGSSFHQDPNATSAWNAVIYGSKKWILYPPHITPPGVHASADGADVAAPLSLTEWFMNFHKQARKGPCPAVETTVRAGELLFVPRGWWHMAINLEETLAITHNYVSTVNLPHVLKFLRSGRQDLVSGCAIHDRALLHDRFLAALQSHNSEALATVQLPAARKQSSKKHLSHLFQDSTPACSIGVTGEKSSCAPSTHKFGFF